MVQDATTSPRKSSLQQKNLRGLHQGRRRKNAVNPSQDETSNSASLSGSDKVVEKRLQKILHTKNNQMNTNEEGAITTGVHPAYWKDTWNTEKRWEVACQINQEAGQPENCKYEQLLKRTEKRWEVACQINQEAGQQKIVKMNNSQARWQARTPFIFCRDN